MSLEVPPELSFAKYLAKPLPSVSASFKSSCRFSLASWIKIRTLSSKIFDTFASTLGSSGSSRGCSDNRTVETTKERTCVNGIAVNRNWPSRTSRTAIFFRTDSPSTREVATLDPGWLIRKVPTTDSVSSISHSCSWPQQTKSIQSGIMSSLMQFLAPRPRSRFWCRAKMLNQPGFSSSWSPVVSAGREKVRFSPRHMRLRRSSRMLPNPYRATLVFPLRNKIGSTRIFWVSSCLPK
mmetsp:Transcript_3043/g.6557  ORF Transcript_3043/g.6557 Transcript_3043/m.6557 type:complete len:237 (-) Transcript_3043:563-1273(-)